MNYKFAIVVSQFNENITDKLLQGTLDRLAELNIHPENIFVSKVPGAIEIPLVAKILAKSSDYDAIICLGAVIRGETSHYDYVCQQVSYGCQRVMLDHEIPVVFGMLTTNTVVEAEERVGGKEGHKGKEAADTALSMVKLVDQLTA